MIWLVAYQLVNFSTWTIGAYTAGTPGYWLVSAYGAIFNAIVFYGHAYFLIPRFLNRKSWPVYLGTTILLVGATSLLESWIDFALTPHYVSSYLADFSEILWESVLTHTVFFLFLSLLYRFSIDWFTHQQLQRELREEKLRAELSFLKAQINPHFLFNTLNNLFASSQQAGDHETAAGIAQLVDLMRYMLEDSEAELVGLTKEMQFLEAYIDLQKRRLAAGDPVQITFTKEGEMTDRQIAPLLLIPFVENAFKHGVRFYQPSSVDIRLKMNAQRLDFVIVNTIHPPDRQAVVKENSLGLKNVRKRLELHYPGRYQLKTVEDNEYFTIHLTLDNLPSRP